VRARRLLAARLTRRGGGTAAPGLVAEQIDPAALRKLGAALAGGALVIGGTNGKTTTAHMVATILDKAGRRVVHNRSGSNLVRGVWRRSPRSRRLDGVPRGDVGVIEADEAALPAIVTAIRPRFILLNNLFRDQLDRYGELDHIATRWRAAVATLDADTTLIVNADDPMLVGVTAALPRERIIYFGMAAAEPAAVDRRLTLDVLPHAADAATCSRCGGRLAYRALYLSHLGDWFCPACGNARPAPDIVARDIRLDGVKALSLTVAAGESVALATPPHSSLVTHTPGLISVIPAHVPLPGLYNAYNALAATAAALAFGLSPGEVTSGLVGFTAAFGRIERVALEGREIVLALVKNPTGFNEVLRMLVGGGDADAGLATPTMLIINDLDADGRDVSWLWGCRFRDSGAGARLPLHTAGIRGPDMAVRLKYAGDRAGADRRPPARRVARRAPRFCPRGPGGRDRLHPPDLHRHAGGAPHPRRSWRGARLLAAVGHPARRA
jgi:UDP-N-acetylmuramyl tripeptide synthase